MNAPVILLFLLSLAALVGWAAVLSASLRTHLHILQLEDYSPGRMLAIQLRHLGRWELLDVDLLALPPLLFALGWSISTPALISPSESALHAVTGSAREILSTLLIYAGIALWCWGGFYRARRRTRALKAAKKPLVMTSRAKRIHYAAIALAACALIFLASAMALGFLYVLLTLAFIAGRVSSLITPSGLPFNINPLIWVPLWPLIAMYLVERGSPFFLAAATTLLLPVEDAIQHRFTAEARDIIAKQCPLVIGITGSYGKTSTKEILSALLANKYNLLRPPGSYNTLMGVTRLIREQLRPFHEAFVVEMGAYHRGSIAKLCDLVKPTHGIITIIGVQHLEQFGSQHEIQRAKAELVEALPENGITVLNGDDPLCREIGAKHKGVVVYFSVESSESTTQDLAAHNIRLFLDGTRFDLVFPDGEILPIHLSLLGRAAVANATAAVAMADKLGVRRADIVRTLESLPHVRHRLEPIRRENGITVIDDAYNSNPIGARNALEVLAMATGGRRILVTPGMVELGEMEEEANYEFGRQAATACDLVMLIGRRHIEPIHKGLLDAGFPESAVHPYPALKEALDKLQSDIREGDTILLENDLPDQYADA